jgi:O-antigen/teichoic acid export membrane protein
MAKAATAAPAAGGMSRFVSDSIVTFTLSVLNRVLGIGAGIVLARYLGPVGKGYIAYAPIALGVFVTAMSGVAQAATYQYGRNKLPGGAVHRAMCAITMAASIPCAIIVALIAWLVPSQQVLLATAVALPFALYTTAVTGLLLGADRVSSTNIQGTILSTGFNALTVCLVIFAHADYRVVLAAWVLSYAASALYSYLAVKPFIRDDAPATRAIVVEQASFGATSGLAQLAGYINMRVDVFIVSLVLGARELGLYSLTVNLAELLWQVSGPLCMASFPRIGNSDDRTSAAFTAKLIRHIFMIMIPAGLICFFAGPPLLTLAYGAPFAGSGEALRWIIPGVVAYSVEVPLGYFLLIRLGRPWLIVAIQSTSVVVCALLTFATIHRYGINGAAAATSITYVAVVAVKAAIFMRATGTPLSRLVLVRREDLTGLLRIARQIVSRVTRFIPARA